MVPMAMSIHLDRDPPSRALRRGRHVDGDASGVGRCVLAIIECIECRECPELKEESKVVANRPDLSDLAIGDAVDVDTLRGDAVAGGGSAQELITVSSTQRPQDGHAI